MRIIRRIERTQGMQMGADRKNIFRGRDGAAEITAAEMERELNSVVRIKIFSRGDN